jgi:hypothetical protein
VPRVCIKIAVHLRLPFLTPSCDANSRFPHAYPRVAMLKAPIRSFISNPVGSMHMAGSGLQSMGFAASPERRLVGG